MENQVMIELFRGLCIWGGMLIAGILIYNCFIQYSIGQENATRFSDDNVLRALAPVDRQGNSELPAILFLHGFGGSPNDFRPLINVIPEDYTVYAPRLPGHGAEDSHDLNNITFDDWRIAARFHSDYLLGVHDHIIICGFSIGGILALDVAKYARAEAVILINPYVGTPHRMWYILPPSVWASAISPIIPYVKKLRSGQINCDRGRSLYEPGYWHLSMRAYKAFYYQSVAALKSMPEINSTVYLHISQNDIVSDPRRMETLVKSLSIDEDRVCRWHKSNHVLMFDYDSRAAIQAIIDHIRKTTQSVNARANRG